MELDLRLSVCALLARDRRPSLRLLFAGLLLAPLAPLRFGDRRFVCREGVQAGAGRGGKALGGGWGDSGDVHAHGGAGVWWDDGARRRGQFRPRWPTQGTTSADQKVEFGFALDNLLHYAPEEASQDSRVCQFLSNFLLSCESEMGLLSCTCS